MSTLPDDQAKAYMVKLLTAMSRAGGSDLFISVDFPPTMKAHGKMQSLAPQKLNSALARQLTVSMMNEQQREEFARELELQFRRQPARRGALSRQRVPTAAAGRDGDPDDSRGDSEFPGAGAARDSQGHRHDQARARPPGRRHRFGQVHVAGRHDRSSQSRILRPHHHGGGSGGIRASVAEVARHPPGGGHRHAFLASRRSRTPCARRPTSS